MLAYGTPKYGYIDALGRVTESYEKNIYHDPIDATDKEQDIRMQYSYDISGNLLYVTDALERTAFSHKYDLANRSLKSTHIDSGASLGLPDALNRPVFALDAKNAAVLSAFDIASRPAMMWALDSGFDYNASITPNPFTLRSVNQYGDSSGLTDPEDQNLLGKIWRSYDEAGRMETPEYDFKGNPLESTRKVIDVGEIMSVFSGPPTDWQVNAYRVNWDPADLPALLDARDYTTALSRSNR